MSSCPVSVFYRTDGRNGREKTGPGSVQQLIDYASL